jgi:GAF domain-containing protein/anti-sigma regulatory factor (Ser/Thr protein kinase)
MPNRKEPGRVKQQIERLLNAERQLIAILGRRLTEEDALREGLSILCRLLKARYGAVGLVDEEGHLVRFVHHGLDEETVRLIGDPPRGTGLLGVLLRSPDVIRLDDLTRDPRHAAFPPHHPAMKSFLGVPVSGEQRTHGRLYLADKEGGRGFTEEDAILASGFAGSIGVALDNLRLERARADFLAMLSHDIRSPLSVVLGYTQMLREDAVERMTDEEQRVLEAISEGGERILHLVENFLLASRLDAGKLDLVRVECDVHELVRRVARFYARSASARGLHIELDLQRGTSVIMANEEGLSRVFSNLITNAVKHSPPGGTIRVQLRADAKTVTLDVSDAGCGICADDQQRLFQRYGRVTSGHRLGGTGLGLYIVKAIAEAHGGSVSVQSAPGAGATFTVRLPR